MFIGYTNYRLIHTFKRIADKKDIQIASRELLRSLGIDIDVRGSFLHTGPQLIIANHVTLLDMFKLLAIIPRDDVYLIAFVLNRILGKEFNKYLLPVYLSDKPNNSFLEWLRVQYWIPRQRYISPIHARDRNRQTISRAASLLKDNHSVIIFPSGFNIVNSDIWHDGIGYLLLQLNHRNIPIVPVNLGGNSLSDILRYINFGIFSPLSFHSTTTITIGPTFYSEDVLKGELTGKIITSRVHEKYTNCWN